MKTTRTKPSWKALLAALLSTFLLVGIDQWSKSWASMTLYDGRTVTVIPHVVQFRYLVNTGMAFSLLSQKTVLLSVITAIVLVTLMILYVRGTFPTRAFRIGIILLLAGGIGNWIDRTFHGFVVDFIEFTFTRFAVFNFADCCVTIGAAILILALLFDTRNQTEKEKQDQHDGK